MLSKIRMQLLNGCRLNRQSQAHFLHSESPVYQRAARSCTKSTWPLVQSGTHVPHDARLSCRQFSWSWRRYCGRKHLKQIRKGRLQLLILRFLPKLIRAYRLMSLVGSRTGAATRKRSPFPAPATSHVACGLPALRVPACFTTLGYGAYRDGAADRWSMWERSI